MQQLPKNTLLQGGKYKIEKVLGQGGFGITYLATQELLDRKVCIKEFFFKEYCERDEATSHVSLGTQSNHDIVERFMTKFLKEARTISQLDHRNIIKIHDIFKENNTAYYVMDYVEGESLNDMVNRRGALPEKEAVAYIERVGDALKYIHQHNINHLDIKPSNIMIRQGDYRVILIDFGLSKQYDEQGGQTSTTPVGISHGYAPMEQYKQGGVSTFSPQTDIYSLGATLYKLVTGNTPPQAMDILDEGLPSLPSSISSSVAETIKKTMQPRKLDRPKSIEEFLSGLNVSTQSTDTVQDEVKVQSMQIEYEETMILNHLESKERKQQTRYVDDRPKPTISFEPVEKKEEKKNKDKVGCSLILILGCFILFFMLRNCDNSNSTNTSIGTQSSTPESIYNEALTYYDSKDYVNAIPLLEKTAGMGYAPAQALLGYCYSNGEGVSKNDALAFEWTKRAADQNDLMASYNLGVFYFNGVGVNRNEETAVYWWNRAAHEGYISAQYNIGLCYFYGNGIKKNVVKAKEWLEKAASQGYEDAKKFLKENNFGEKKNQKVSNTENKQQNKSMTIEDRALAGDAEAQYQLGVKYCGLLQRSYGKTADEHRDNMKLWWSKSAEQGHTKALYEMALLYETTDLNKCIEYLNIASNKGDLKSTCYLGSVYERRTNLINEAIKYYSKAANLGYADAEYHLGRCYFYGTGVNQDINKCISWYTKAAQKGHGDAQYQLASCYYFGYQGLDKNYATAAKWWEKSAKTDVTKFVREQALQAAARCYIKGGYGLSKDLNKATMLLKDAGVSANEISEFITKNQ